MNTRIFAYPNANVRNLTRRGGRPEPGHPRHAHQGRHDPVHDGRHAVDSRRTIARGRHERGEDRRGRRDRSAQRAAHHLSAMINVPASGSLRVQGKHDPDRRVVGPSAAASPRHDRGARLLRAWRRTGDRRGRRGERFGVAGDRSVRDGVAELRRHSARPLRFGKLTMVDSDLDLVDADSHDPFDFYLHDYQCQLAAGVAHATLAVRVARAHAGLRQAHRRAVPDGSLPAECARCRAPMSGIRVFGVIRSKADRARVMARTTSQSHN